MKSTYLFCVSLTVLCFTFQNASSQSTPDGGASSTCCSSPSPDDNPSDSSSPQGDSSPGTLPTDTEPVLRFCTTTSRLWRPGNTYNDPSTLIVSPPNCCFACQEDELCVAWSWDRVTRACALKDRLSEPFFHQRYTSNGNVSLGETQTYRMEIYPEGFNRTIGSPRASEAQGLASLNDCYSESGASYPNGNILRRMRTRTHVECCDACRNDDECFSWYRSAQSRRCILNRNVPGRVNRGTRYAGATTI